VAFRSKGTYTNTHIDLAEHSATVRTQSELVAKSRRASAGSHEKCIVVFALLSSDVIIYMLKQGNRKIDRESEEKGRVGRDDKIYGDD
jgi:hypothetical protein